MLDLELLGDYLVQLRQEKLQQGHAFALTKYPQLIDVQLCAHEAELCSRIHAAVKTLAKDPGTFIKEYLK